MMLDKWKRAVVHLECATDSEHFYDRIHRLDELRARLDQGQISHEEFGEEILGRSRDLRFQGTALFMEHERRRYLVTARHVVWDEHSAKREMHEEQRRAAGWPDHMRPHLVNSAQERAMQNIFNIIFRVPSLDEVHDQVSQPEFLMNLGAGTSWSTPYILSAPDLDLAIISLDQRDSRFAEQLLSLGYKPVESSCVANGPSQEGEHVFTVGFPGSTSVLGQVSQHPASAQWSSSHVSLPVFSFGHVSMLHEALPFFWTDMSIYPGNSGGPVVADDRLVGIVSSQATLPFDHDPEIRSRIPFGKITRAEFIRPLLNELIKKDQEHEA